MHFGGELFLEASVLEIAFKKPVIGCLWIFPLQTVVVTPAFAGPLLGTIWEGLTPPLLDPMALGAS